MTRKRFKKLCMSLPYYDRNSAEEYAERVQQDGSSYQKQWNSEKAMHYARIRITEEAFKTVSDFIIAVEPLFNDMKRNADLIVSNLGNIRFPTEVEELEQ